MSQSPLPFPRQEETDDAAPGLGTRLLNHLTDQALKRELKP